MEVFILGSGPSSAIPSIRCLLNDKDCAVCHEAYANPLSKNRRNNPSLLIRYNGANVLIDCGKTFRESVLKVFPPHQVLSLDAVVLTHGHADACLGMDDLRELQVFKTTRSNEIGEAQKIADEPLYVHCHARTQAEVFSKFDYLMVKKDAVVNTKAAYRWTAKLDWKLFQDFEIFSAAGIEIQALPVLHGRDYVSNGFEFGMEVGKRFVYISDVTDITEETMTVLLDGEKGPIDVLVIDSLYWEDIHGTHMNFQDAKQAIERLQPRKTYLTGMSHEFDYEKHNVVVKSICAKMDLDVEMAFDGLQIIL